MRAHIGKAAFTNAGWTASARSGESLGTITGGGAASASPRWHDWTPRRSALVLALVLIISALGALGLPTAHAVESSGDVVVDWNRTALRAAANAGHPSPVQILDLAIVHAAVYDAVNSIDGRHQPYAVQVPEASPDASQEAAAATAAYQALRDLFPEQQESLEAAYQASLADVPDGEQEDAGVSVGQQAAAAIIALRSDDGRFDEDVTFERKSGPGAWVPTPPFPADYPGMVPWVAKVTPFTMRSTDQFRVDPPPSVTSELYTEDFEEVRTMGAKLGSKRTPEQTAIAEFFEEPPTGAWSRAIQGIALAEKHTVADSARLFALVNLAAADAQISCWDSKYTYSYWRPITAIHAADTDGNPNTTADSDWRPLLFTPPFPEYPAGHTTFTGAVTQVLRDFYGTDRFSFTMSNAFSGTTRSYDRFSQVTKEVIDGRVWAGSHFRTADVVGAAAGLRIGLWVTQNVAAPLSSPQAQSEG